MKNTVTCTVCPNGCEIEVNYTTKEDAVLTGYACKRGITYAIDECFEPKRTFTSSVRRMKNQWQSVFGIALKIIAEIQR